MTNTKMTGHDSRTIADRIGIHHCFIIPALCYLYIVWYGWKDHVPRPGQGTVA